MKRLEGYVKGVNLGGWISQYDHYDPKHFATFIVKDDIANIASLGFDHVRVPVDYQVLEDEEGNVLESGYQYLQNCCRWCREYGLKMIIDLHECYGYSFDPLKKDIDRKKFFYDEALQARFMKLWRQIASRFSQDSDMVAYEPLNEVVLFEVADAWNQILRKFIQLIREISPQSYIFVGGVCYNSVTTIPLLDIPVDDRIVYNFHCYEPLIFTHQGAYWVDNMPSDFRIGYPKTLQQYQKASQRLSKDLAGAIFKEGISQIGTEFFEDIFAVAVQKAQQDQVALYCGEYGVIDLADNQDKLRWLKDIHEVFNRHGIGRALWNYKEKDFGFEDERFASIRQDFIDIL